MWVSSRHRLLRQTAGVTRYLQLLERGIYANSRSPYRRLLEHAGYKFEDVQALVRDQGLEGALSHLHDKGIYVTLDEFKGRAPIRRPGLEFSVSAFDFDNPLLTSHLAGSSGASRGSGTRVPIDLDFIAYEAAENFARSQPMVSWVERL